VHGEERGRWLECERGSVKFCRRIWRKEGVGDEVESGDLWDWGWKGRVREGRMNW
jgi:hypothetical protein